MTRLIGYLFPVLFVLPQAPADKTADVKPVGEQKADASKPADQKASPAASAAVKSPLTLVDVDPPILRADQNGAATATLTLRGSAPKGVLSLTDFHHKKADGHEYRLFTTATLAPLKATDSTILEGNAPYPEDGIAVRLTVSNLWEAGASTATLKYGQTVIPIAGSKDNQLQAIRIPPAYNVHIQSETPAHPEVLSSPDHLPVLRLVNSDAMTYQFRWQLRNAGGQVVPQQPDIIEVPGNGFVDLSLKDAPSPTLLSAGTLRDAVEPAEITLTPALGDLPIQPLAPKVLPVWLRLRYWNDGLQELINLFVLVVLLTIGGVASIWVHCGMPNTTRALAIRRRLRLAQERVKGLSDDVDSRWRVLLAFRVRKLWGDLYSTAWVFPAFATVIDQLSKDVGTFEVWVECAHGVGLVLQGTREALPHGFPPTVLEWIETNCRAALEPIESGATTPDQLQSMRTAYAAACSLLDAVVTGKPISDLEKAILDREAGVSKDADALSTALPEFESLVKQVTDAPPTITPRDYIDRDMVSRKAELLNEFRELRERVSLEIASPSGAASRLQQYGDRLLDYIRPETPRSLQRAQLFLLEMKEDIYVEGLETEAQKTPPAIDFVTVPATAEARLPILFRVRFSREALNGAASCREWRCNWTFGDGTPEELGWTAFHEFRSAGDYQVTVTLFSLEDGQPIVTLPPRTLKVANPGRQEEKTGGYFRYLKGMFRRTIDWFSPETKLEASRLVLVLAAAVIGLIGVAQQRVDSLSLLEAVFAVCALGFGADTLKNLVSQG